MIEDDILSTLTTKLRLTNFETSLQVVVCDLTTHKS